MPQNHEIRSKAEGHSGDFHGLRGEGSSQPLGCKYWDQQTLPLPTQDAPLSWMGMKLIHGCTFVVLMSGVTLALLHTRGAVGSPCREVFRTMGHWGMWLWVWWCGLVLGWGSQMSFPTYFSDSVIRTCFTTNRFPCPSAEPGHGPGCDCVT